MEVPGWLWALTHLGNSVLLICAAGIVAAWAAWGGATRLAVWGWCCFCFAVFLVLVSKLAFFGWGWGIAALDFTGISGHAMLSAAVLPVVALAFTARCVPFVRHGSVWIAYAVALAVAWSRLEINAHSLSEVVVGTGLGAAVSLVVMRLSRAQTWPGMSVVPLTAALAVLLAATAPRGGEHEGPRTHGLVVQMALWLSGHTEPYSRPMLHQPGLHPPRKLDRLADGELAHERKKHSRDLVPWVSAAE